MAEDREHRRFLLNQHLQMIEHLEQTVTQFEAQIEAALNPFRAAVERLTIPGVSTTAAHVIIAEIGVDMSRFPTVGHLRSWADCVRNSTRARVTSCRGGYARVPSGLSRCWFSARGPRPAARTATSTGNS